MSGLKQVRAHVVLNSELGQSPSSVRYLALMTTLPTGTTAGVEVTGGSYARQAITFAAASGGQSASSNAQTFPAASSSYSGPVVGWCIFDASTSGNQITFDDWTPITIGTGDQIVADAGDIIVQLS